MAKREESLQIRNKKSAMPTLAENATGETDPVETDQMAVRTLQIEFHENGTEIRLEGKVEESDSFGKMEEGTFKGDEGESKTIHNPSAPIMRVNVVRGEASVYYR